MGVEGRRHRAHEVPRLLGHDEPVALPPREAVRQEGDEQDLKRLHKQAKDFARQPAGLGMRAGAMPPAEVIRLVEEGAGRHFDPAIAAAMVRLFARGALDVDAMPSQIMNVLPARSQ